AVDLDGRCALHLAAQAGSLEAVKLCLMYGSEVGQFPLCRMISDTRSIFWISSLLTCSLPKPRAASMFRPFSGSTGMIFSLE
ncbi:hypothetical protein, partial [Pontibacterium sp.]|uniref:hypothetical protein n=1 Tax=Pontibacterium sp. TaxID=2036026 RepID=UPI0035633103